MESEENEHLEFKEAKASFEFEELIKYCAAIANEGGGHLILGVTDKKPRRIVGSQAFSNLERTKAGLVERLHVRVDAEALNLAEGRVVVFEVPSRPLGYPIPYKGAYWMRAGGSLAPMTPDMLKNIFSETGPDFSAEVCANASLTDLEPAAIDRLRTLWRRKSGNELLDRTSREQLLSDTELTVDGRVTYAALILLGTQHSLGKHLGSAEVVFEYRSSDASIPYQQRTEFRKGFLLFLDELWEAINYRNDVQHFQDGLFIWDIPTFNEAAIREAILNAVAHRDYRLGGSVFVREYPRRLEIISPGGFPPGITSENILYRQAPRNRRIAEVFAKCGLVERSGQGVDRMFEACIKEGKPHPDFSQSDNYQVAVKLEGEIRDPQFLRFLEKVGSDKIGLFTTRDLLVLDLVHREQPVAQDLRDRLHGLVESGIVEMVGRGKGSRFILSRQFYGFLGKKGVYTRKRGLDRETNKALLLRHIHDNAKDGTGFQELVQVLPALSRNQIQTLLRELKREGRIRIVGRTKSGRWYPELAPEGIAPKRNYTPPKTQS
jgi:ATP-dependent DNA helicase RecG